MLQQHRDRWGPGMHWIHRTIPLLKCQPVKPLCLRGHWPHWLPELPAPRVTRTKSYTQPPTGLWSHRLTEPLLLCGRPHTALAPGPTGHVAPYVSCRVTWWVPIHLTHPPPWAGRFWLLRGLVTICGDIPLRGSSYLAPGAPGRLNSSLPRTLPSQSSPAHRLLAVQSAGGYHLDLLPGCCADLRQMCYLLGGRAPRTTGAHRQWSMVGHDLTQCRQLLPRREQSLMGGCVSSSWPPKLTGRSHPS